MFSRALAIEEDTAPDTPEMATTLARCSHSLWMLLLLIKKKQVHEQKSIYFK